MGIVVREGLSQILSEQRPERIQGANVGECVLGGRRAR